MSGNELLQKVITTTNVGADNGGLLNAEQANKFLDYMWDATSLGDKVRTVRMKSDTVDIDKVAIGQRIARLATEATDDGVNAGATFTKISLTTEKFRLDWELSTESLEDNIEGAALEDHIARLMATQFGVDMEDQAINGVGSGSDPLLKAYAGWRSRLLGGAHVIDHGGAALNLAAFNKALKAMPRKYMQRRQGLRWLTGSNLIQDYLYGLTQTQTGVISVENVAQAVRSSGPVRTEGDAGFTGFSVFGIAGQEVPLFDEGLDGTYSGATGDHGDLWLTDPQNLLWGVKREVTVYREFKPKKDTIEYTVYMRAGVQVQHLDAAVVVRNIKVSS